MHHRVAVCFVWAQDWNDRNIDTMKTTQFGPLICLEILSRLIFAMLFVLLSHHALDIPKDCSAHTQATPRGGGCAIWIAYPVGLIVLTSLEHIRVSTFTAFLGTGSLAMFPGLLDDLAEERIKAETCLVLHVAAVGGQSLGSVVSSKFKSLASSGDRTMPSKFSSLS